MDNRFNDFDISGNTIKNKNLNNIDSIIDYQNFNEDLYNEWSKEVPLQKEITTYYLNRENAIEEERDYISGTNKKFYLQLEDEKEEKKTEISKKIFDTQMSAYNEITANNITSTYGTRLVKIPPKN